MPDDALPQPIQLARAAVIALALAAMPLAACQAPATQPPLDRAEARGLSLTFQLPPERQLLVTSNAYTRGDIHHMVVKLYRMDGETEVLLETVDLPENRLDAPITFSGLVGLTRYRVRSDAYRLPGTDPLDRISRPEGSITEVEVKDDNVVAIEPLRVQLRGVSPLVGEPMAGHLTGNDPQNVPRSLMAPRGLEIDASGAIYVADTDRQVIRRLDTAGVLETIAGTPSASGAVDATGLSASFNRPMGLALDGSGNVIVADRDNHLIRQITPGGGVTTLAGDTQGDLFYPEDVAVGPDGAIYIADVGSFKIRKLQGQILTTLAGSGDQGYQDGVGANAMFDTIVGLDVDASGVVYVAERGSSVHHIRRIRPDGFVTTLIGQGSGTIEDRGSPDSEIQLPMPYALDVDAAGHLYVATSAGVLKRDRRGEVRLLKGFRPDGTATGFEGQRAIAVSRRGRVFTVNTEAPPKVIQLK